MAPTRRCSGARTRLRWHRCSARFGLPATIAGVPPCLPGLRQGLGIEEILEAVVERVPPPADHRDRQLRALIFDSYYDSYKVGGRGRGWGAWRSDCGAGASNGQNHDSGLSCWAGEKSSTWSRAVPWPGVPARPTPLRPAERCGGVFVRWSRCAGCASGVEREPLSLLPAPSSPLQGVIVQFRVMDGELRKGDLVKFMNTGCEYDITELGVLSPKAVEVRRPRTARHGSQRRGCVCCRQCKRAHLCISVGPCHPGLLHSGWADLRGASVHWALSCTLAPLPAAYCRWMRCTLGRWATWRPPSSR